MKNTILIFVLLITGIKMNSQEIFLKQGHTITELQKGTYYRLSPEDADKFKGTWTSTNKRFVITISTEKVFLDGPEIYMETLIGKYCANDLNCNFEHKEVTLLGGSISFKDGISANFLFNDQEKNKLGNAKIELFGKNKAKWSVNNREKITINKGKGDTTFSVPTNTILTKEDQ